ncbi:DUF116 domain-containing protein [Sporomusa paucivorans]|uniref:lipoyl protein ligase domain-containing protein n=1 Tax=Sporomusa paucivorans TaxID=2376 RepID=UPI0035715CF5
MKPGWRVIDTGCLTCSQNIALDKALLLACRERLIPDTLRFFQFTAGCVLLGHYQRAEQEVRLDFCQQQSIDINRRLTGGNTVYWDGSLLGWEVVLPRAGQAAANQADTLRYQIAAAIIEGLSQLGVKAQYQYPAAIEAAGRQIAWFSGTRQGTAFFCQGYIRVSDSDVHTLLRALRIPTEKLVNKEVDLFKQSLASLASVLGAPPPPAVIKAAITAGFCRIFQVAACEGKMTPGEEAYYQTSCQEVAARQWVFGSRSVSRPAGYQLRSTLKEQSLITVAMSVDSSRQRIDAISLTGTFEAYPLEVISRLESNLLHIAATPEQIRNTVNDCFRECHACIPTLTADDFSNTILKALEKLQFLNWGAGPAELNELTVVGNFAIQKIFEQPLTTLLIPYCAKDTECRYRYREGCGQCGRCDVGDAYALAAEYGLAPITIQNYEMLEENLKALKQAGCKVFIGTCCEAFWVKHARDFAEIGLPGILVNVDNSTCYELGREQAARQGRFENQTKLKKQLIRQIVNGMFNNRDASYG